MAKQRYTVYLDKTLVDAARRKLDKPPKKSLSAWIEEQLHKEFIR